MSTQEQTFVGIDRNERLPLNVGTDRERYLELLRRALTDLLVAAPRTHKIATARENVGEGLDVTDPWTRYAFRLKGLDWPEHAVTMAGYERLSALQRHVQTVMREGVLGDFVELGAWRGGSSMLMREVLGNDSRLVWVADSFAGFDPSDGDAWMYDYEYLSVDLEQVLENFLRFGVDMSRVRFVKGFVRDTLPGLLGMPWSLIRLDLDTYEATMLALEALYPTLSAGGFVVADDYHSVPRCGEAIDEFRERHGITAEIVWDDWSGMHWRKT